MTALRKWDEPRPVTLTIEDYLLLDRSGALDQWGKTELIEGVIVAMNAQHRPHARLKSQLFRRLADAVDRLEVGLEVLVEPSVAMPPSNAPAPDIVVTSEPKGSGLVPLSSVALLVEVSDTTIAYDLGKKAAVYAANAVPEYWVADVKAGELHQMWAPTADGYGERRTVALGEPIEAATVAGLAVETRDV